MRVLLISAADDAGTITPLPFGLACVATATKMAGHNVRLLRLGLAGDWDGIIRQAIREVSPEIIGISVRNIDDQNMQYPRFLLMGLQQVVVSCRAASPSPIVLGGAGYSIFPQSVLAYLGAEMGIRGEGEAAFPALLSWLGNRAQSAPPISVYFANGSHTETAFAADLDRFSLPAPSLWLDQTDAVETRIPVQSRRGCPLDCIFCSTSAIEGRPVRRRSAESVVKWLAELRQRGFRNFAFVDNAFNLPPAYAKKLCLEIIQAELGLDWWAIVYPKWVDTELIQLMAKAGCTQVSLGFESGSETMLQQLNKRFNRAEVEAASGAFAAAGIKRNGFLLLGGPGETRDTIEQSLKFAEGLHLDSLKATVGIRIYPDTPLASRAVVEGLVSPSDDLLFPRFYISPRVRDWLAERVAYLQ